MQSYLSVIDPLLFPILKTVRRALELQPDLKWQIEDEIAVALYAYQAGLPLFDIGNPDLNIKVEANTVEDVSRLESVLAELVRLGFTRNDMTLRYPLALLHINVDLVDRVKPTWASNKKGKLTYPLRSIDEIVKTLSPEKKGWAKEVANHVIIE